MLSFNKGISFKVYIFLIVEFELSINYFGDIKFSF
jgi:hypothetical protein